MSNSEDMNETSRYTKDLKNQSADSQISEANYHFQIIKSGDYKRNRNSSQGVGLFLDGPSQSRLENMDTLSSASIVKLKWKAKCPACFGTSASYYCSTCVRNGNFYHSSTKFLERFAEKRLRERRLRQHIADLERRATLEMPTRFRKDNLKKEIEILKEKNRLIKKVIGNERKKIEKAHEEESILKYQISHLKKTVPLFQRKNANILQNITLYSQRIPQKLQKNEELEKEFQYLAKDKIKELNTTIFPLSKVAADDCGEECHDPIDDATVKGLAEATQEQYVRGRWINASHFMQQKYFSILSVTLPDSAGCTSFPQPQAGSEMDEKADAQRICAGLTYICQLVNIIALYLGIYLPHKISFSDFSDFSRQEMGEKKFQICLTRLNANVIYLCVSQGVPANHLQPLRMVPNLMALLWEGKSDLGRVGSFEFPASVIEILEEFGCYEDNPDSDSEDDWETVTSLPLSELPSSPPLGGGFRRGSIDDTASGIVTSAAASVISMFRGIGNPLK